MKGRLVIVKGAGDLASGVAHRLKSCGFSIILLEMPQPTVIRRTVAFAEAVYQGEVQVEGISARLCQTLTEAGKIAETEKVAVMIDPEWEVIKALKPAAVVDAILAKRNLGTSISDAPVVIGLGPGFNAGVDVHAVVETQRGHDLGRVIYQGRAISNTGIPCVVGGYGAERVLRSPGAGVFTGCSSIGEVVKAGETVAVVGDRAVQATLDGVLRGLLQSGLVVEEGYKVGDIDPRCVVKNCFAISDKARAIAGGVLEALLHLLIEGEALWTMNSGKRSN